MQGQPLVRTQRTATRWLASSAAALVLGVAGSAQAQERQAFFGETHVHTSWSFDAYIFGNHLTGPGRRLRYAKGETIQHPMGYDDQDHHAARLDGRDRPLGICRHGPSWRTTRFADQQAADRREADGARSPPTSSASISGSATTMIEREADQGAGAVPRSPAPSGRQNNESPTRRNEPGKFTAFCSYEWTSTPDNRNMHRNIFFKDCAKVPDAPFSSLRVQAPEDLWNWMDGQRQAGNELLAISHNANLSDGHMFPTEVDFKGRPIDAAWADVARPQRAADRDQADQGAVRDPSAAVAERRVRQLRGAELPARRPAGPVHRRSPAATSGRR